MGSSWVTLAEHVRTPSWVLTELRPGTVYLFLVRSANAHGLSDPSPISNAVRTHGQWGSGCLTIYVFWFLYAFI